MAERRNEVISELGTRGTQTTPGFGAAGQQLKTLSDGVISLKRLYLAIFGKSAINRKYLTKAPLLCPMLHKSRVTRHPKHIKRRLSENPILQHRQTTLVASAALAF